MGLLRVIKLFPGQGSQLEPNHKPHQVHTLLAEIFCTSETRRILSSRLCNHHSAVGILLEENSSSASSREVPKLCFCTPTHLSKRDTQGTVGAKPLPSGMVWFVVFLLSFFSPLKVIEYCPQFFHSIKSFSQGEFFPFFRSHFQKKKPCLVSMMISTSHGDT